MTRDIMSGPFRETASNDDGPVVAEPVAAPARTTGGRGWLVVGAVALTMVAAGFGATITWTAGKLASAAIGEATDHASDSLDVIASAVTAEAQQPSLEPVAVEKTVDLSPVIDLRGSLGGVESAPAPAAELDEPLYTPETETRLAELERKAEALSRISDYAGGSAPRRSSGAAAH